MSLCKYCGGDIEIRNPTGNCDHLYYPENVNKSLKPDEFSKMTLAVVDGLTKAQEHGAKQEFARIQAEAKAFRKKYPGGSTITVFLDALEHGESFID